MNLKILYDKMIERGHTKKELAEVLGISLLTLNRRFKSRDSDSVFSLSEIRKIMEYYNIDNTIYEPDEYIEPPVEICGRRAEIRETSSVDISRFESEIKALKDSNAELNSELKSLSDSLDNIVRNKLGVLVGELTRKDSVIYQKIRDMIIEDIKSNYKGVTEISLSDIQPVKSAPGKVKGMVDDDMTFESAEDAWKALHVD